MERNPVRAGLVKKAESYPWSSAAGHCGLLVDPLLAPLLNMYRPVSENEWSDWLAVPDDVSISALRRNVEKGLPCGSDTFINKLEKLADRNLRFRSQGRPK